MPNTAVSILSTRHVYSYDYVPPNRVRYFQGRVINFNQSEARKQCFLASDWLKLENLSRKYRTLSAISVGFTRTSGRYQRTHTQWRRSDVLETYPWYPEVRTRLSVSQRNTTTICTCILLRWTGSLRRYSSRFKFICLSSILGDLQVQLLLPLD